MEGKNPVVIKIGEKLLEKLKEIQEHEKLRGREVTSYRTAGEILARRIDNVGGLKPIK